MALTCRAASRISLDSLGGHAAEAQRLELEAHLAVCERCRDEHAWSLGLVRGLANIVPESLPTSAEHDVRRALAAWKPSRRTQARPSPWRARVLSGLVVAAAATACFVALRDRTYQITDGDVVAHWVRGSDGVRNVDLRSESGGRVRVAGATVDLGPATEVVWHKESRVADLRRGRVTVDVEHRDGQYLAVRTPRFTVEVIGTRFTVDPTGVRTERGAVRVIRPDGSLAARVAAGGTWSLDAPPAPGALEGTAPATSRAAPVASPGPSAVSEPARRPAGTSPGLGLTSARRALARGDTQTARRMAEALFHQGRGVAVEARIIFAESFLAEGRYLDAVAGYRIVAREFPSTPQAEISQFAIAQLEAEHGSRAQARAAFQAYLASHPHGRFAKEATSRLSRLSVRER
jgi:ferric-dicitrate binding protein FerR (iron transport regulator)